MDIMPSLQKVRCLRSATFSDAPGACPSPSLVRHLKYRLAPVFLTCLLLGAAPAAVAQGFSGLDDIDATGMSYHRFVRPGEATVEVLMLGSAGASGLYVIGMDTGLPEFLALSGVSMGSSGGNEKTDVTVRLYRQQGTNREVIYEAPLEEVLTAPAQIPVFMDGDIVYLESRSRRRVDWLQLLRSVSSIATLIYVVERVVSGRR